MIGDPAVVAAEFNATIREILVKEGQAVSKGEVVAHITSQNMAESRARLISESVQRSAKLAEMQIRSSYKDCDGMPTSSPFGGENMLET